MKTPKRAAKGWQIAAMLIFVLGSIWSGNANRLLVRTKSGLLEYDLSAVQSISFGGDVPTSTKRMKNPSLVKAVSQIKVFQTTNGLSFAITLRPDAEYSVALYDLAGNLITSHNGVSKDTNVHFHPSCRLNQGLYLLRVKTSTETTVFRAIKL